MISVYRCVFVSFTGRGPPRRRCSLHWPLTGLKWGMITWMRSVLPQRSGPNITTNGVSSRSSSAERMDPSRSSLMYAPPHSSGFWNRTSYCRIRSFSVLSMEWSNRLAIPYRVAGHSTTRARSQSSVGFTNPYPHIHDCPLYSGCLLMAHFPLSLLSPWNVSRYSSLHWGSGTVYCFLHSYSIGYE